MRLRGILSSFGNGRRRNKQEKAENNPHPVREVSNALETPLDAKAPCKPTWRCFSYEEIHGATNGFRQGTLLMEVCFSSLCLVCDVGALE